ncbi:TetR family transcriptional regulator [Natranaerovirga hydrolytica]|uniref:TetR family transcriptional regulator n=1 Tax=Natranaerovirga hydrolytica TaxID=680378 RepID=A0A4V2Q1S6_9FIRM|nr:TetR/AcrR family transcriptional regulator [Natranaerovirga hydrolytica]TCK98681.1 TetR family transcriptional regulator [Natranaerovirga hydrolytica]
MQIKKEEVREAILTTAEKEFLEKGFNNASLRKIVKNAGTTIGNFYNYYESKEALFVALVEKEYNGFIHLINGHHAIKKPEINEADKNDIGLIRTIINHYLEDFVKVLSDRFILLIECSEGTPYEDTKQLIIRLLEEHFIEHIQEHNANYSNKEMGEILAKQFLEGFTDILRKYKKTEIRQKLITELIVFYSFGVMALTQ